MNTVFKYRQDTDVKHSASKSLIFQAVDWKADDVAIPNDDPDDETPEEKEYDITCFGCMSDGTSVGMTIKGFCPYFYVKIPQTWAKAQIKKLMRVIRRKVYYKYQEALVSSEIVKRKEFMGFTAETNFKYLEIVVRNLGAYYSFRNAFKETEDEPLKISSISSSRTFSFQLYESNITPFIRFFHLSGVRPAGWIKLSPNTYKVVKSKSRQQTKCQIEIIVDDWKSVKCHESDEIAPLLVASMDIECTSGDGTFPQARRKDDKIIQICTTIHRYGETECCLKHCITLNKSDPIDGVIIEECKTERQLILKWTQFINRLSPDILTGYNIWGFDFEYMYDRAKLFGCEKRFLDISKLKNFHPKSLLEKNLSSSAMGNNFLKYFDAPGIIQIDLLKFVLREGDKLTSYKLDNVAKHYLKSQKVDLSPKELFKNYNIGTPEKMREIAVYCVQDCVLCNELIMKLEVIANQIGMANVCFIPLAYNFLRGLGIRIYSIVLNYTTQYGYVIPVITKDEKASEESYEGAIVLEPNTGIFFEPVTVMDYASLYPSSMISANISHDSLVMDEKYNNHPDYNYYDITYDDYAYEMSGRTKKKIKTGTQTTCRYARNKNGDMAILPRILVELLDKRRETRRSIKFKTVMKKTKSGKTTKIIGSVVQETKTMMHFKDKNKKVRKVKKSNIISMKDTYTPFQRAILNGLQLAYKVVCNTVYGQCGASTSAISCRKLAASTTAEGRKVLYEAKYFVEREYPGAKTVYGDSVTADTPIMIKTPNSEIKHITIDKLESENDIWYQYNSDKKATDINNISIWTETGWTPIKRVIKHKVNKKIFRVLTHTGVVDVTEDHSLLNPDGEKITPNECKVGTKLLQSFPYVSELPRESRFSEIDSYISLVETYDLEFTNKLDASVQYTVMKQLGYNVYINIKEDNPNIYQLTATKTKQKHTENAIKKIVDVTHLYQDQYVYDLETENHHFMAGVGNIIVHNTDSIFVNFTPYIRANPKKFGKNPSDKEILQLTMDLSIEAAQGVTNILREPQQLEPEKTFWPFILFSKKRYTGFKYTFDVNKYKQTSMGIVLKRRDNANIVKKIYGGIIDIILKEKNIEKSIEFYKKCIEDLLNGKVDINDLVITKSLRAEYADCTKIAHKVLSDRMGRRDPGNKPQSNDRIPYCYISEKALKCESCRRKVNPDNCICLICNEMFCSTHIHCNNHMCTPRCRFCWNEKNIRQCSTCKGYFCSNHKSSHKCTNLKPKILQGHRIENYKYIIEKKIPIDYRYYVDRQLIKPISQIYDLTDIDTDSILKDILRKDDNRKTGQREITSFFKFK